MDWSGVAKADRLPGVRPTSVNRPFIDPQKESCVTAGMTAGVFRSGPRYRTVRRHGRSDWLVILTVGGAGALRHGERVVRLGPHSVVVMLQDHPHDYGTVEGTPMWLFAYAHVHPRPAWRTAAASWPRPLPGMAVLEVADAAVWRQAWSAMGRARELSASPLRGRDELALSEMETALRWCDQANPSAGALLDPRVRAAADFAARHADRAVDVEAMAEAAGMSASRLRTLFREQVGESPASYAERLRLERAASLIAAGGLSVKEAAAASGYEDPFHFSRRFHLRLGRPPSVWRASRAGGQ